MPSLHNHNHQPLRNPGKMDLSWRTLPLQRPPNTPLLRTISWGCPWETLPPQAPSLWAARTCQTCLILHHHQLAHRNHPNTHNPRWLRQMSSRHILRNQTMMRLPLCQALSHVPNLLHQRQGSKGPLNNLWRLPTLLHHLCPQPLDLARPPCLLRRMVLDLRQDLSSLVVS